MAQVSDWSTIEEQNVKLDNLTLSGEGGLYSNKIMCAVKKKFDDVDGKLSKVQGAYVFKGVKADMTALEAVTSPAVGDVYSVTALGGENYAWDGTAWDSLGTSDANVVHKTGSEDIEGAKTFKEIVTIEKAFPRLVLKNPDADISDSNYGYFDVAFEDKNSEVVSTISTEKSAEKAVVFTMSAGNLASDDFSAKGSVALLQPYNSSYFRFYPGGTGVCDLGTSNHLWKEVFATEGTINTSDERIKTSINEISNEVLEAWGDIDWVLFKKKKAVEEKGDKARLHSGLIAQRVDEAFKKHGLDASGFGFFCHDKLEEAVSFDNEKEKIEDLYSLRYTEALCIECAYLRSKIKELEKKISDLGAGNGND